MKPGKARNIELTLAAGLLAAGLLMGGCSQTPGYPTLPEEDVIGQTTLTPKQQDAEIKDLTDAQAQNTAQAEPPSKVPKMPKYIPAPVSETE